MSTTTTAWHDHRGIARLTVGDGDRHNALPPTAWGEIEAWATEPSTRDAPAAVIAGAGDAFSSGADLDAWRHADAAEIDATFEAMESAVQAVERIDAPTVAVVRGVALGAGCQLALGCDLRLATSDARIGMPIVRLGILTGDAFAARFARATSQAVAARALLFGHTFAAHDAAVAGLFTHVVDDERLDATLDEWLDALAGQPRSAVRAATRALRGALDVDPGDRAAPRIDAASFHPIVDRMLGDQPRET